MKSLLSCLLTVTLFGGCASTIVLRAPWERVPASKDSATEPGVQPGVTAATDDSKGAADHQVDRVAATLEQIEGLDPQSRATLAADLEKMPPSHRSFVLSQLEAVAQRREHKETTWKADTFPEPPPARTPSPREAKSEARRIAADREARKTEVEPAAYVETDEGAVSERPSVKIARRDTSPFDRLAALAREEDQEPLVESRLAPDTPDGRSIKAANRAAAVCQTAGQESCRLNRSDSRSWQNVLDEAIEKLEAASSAEANSPDDVADLARLRLLCLAAGRRSEALEPIPGLSAEMDAFFTKTLFGIDTWLDNRRISEEDRRAAAALPHLVAAIGNLSEVAPLSVRNLQLCTAVHSFGAVEPFKTDSFRSGQEVLVYAEIENFHSEETPEGFETVLEGSILIFDSRGRRVAEIDLPKKEDRCRCRRRDFFVVYQLQLPERLYPGSHLLKLTIEDAGCRKIGQSTLKFAVSDESEREQVSE